MNTKTIIVTGSGHFPGIGSAIALRFLQLGHNVAVISRSFDSQWAEHQTQNPEHLMLIATDITHAKNQDQIIDQVTEKFHGIDILVNNAAPTDRPCHTQDGILSRESWSLNNLLNQIVPYELSMKCMFWLRQGKGNIINIGSRAGIQTGCGNNIAYSVSKASLHHLTKEMALSCAPVRVNAIAPGLVITKRFSNIYTNNTEARLDQWMNQSLLQQEITDQDVADAALYLAQSHNVTGQILNVCGGATIQPPGINIPPAKS